MTLENILLKKIKSDFAVAQKLRAINCNGQLKISYDFKNELQYNSIISALHLCYRGYEHNFEVCDGVNIMVLWG